MMALKKIALFGVSAQLVLTQDTCKSLTRTRQPATSAVSW